MSEVRTLEGYRAVVLGAPFSLKGWHKDAQRFLDQFPASLSPSTIGACSAGLGIGTGKRFRLGSLDHLYSMPYRLTESS